MTYAPISKFRSKLSVFCSASWFAYFLQRVFVLLHSQNKPTGTVTFCQSISFYCTSGLWWRACQGGWQRSLSMTVPPQSSDYEISQKINDYFILVFHLTGQFAICQLYSILSLAPNSRQIPHHMPCTLFRKKIQIFSDFFCYYCFVTAKFFTKNQTF